MMTEPIYLYRISCSGWRDVEIQKIEVTRFTDKTYWVKPNYGSKSERRCSRYTEWEQVFETYEEAKQARIARADKNIKDLESRIAFLQQDLEKQQQYKQSYLHDQTPESELRIY